MLNANIWKYKAFHALRNIVFFVPIIVLFWQENGLSLTKIMLLQSSYAILVMVLEIPTGYFADRVGRKFSLLLAGFASTVGTLIYSFASSFEGFLIAELFYATFVALISGANSALVYDTLAESNTVHTYRKVWGEIIFIGLMVVSAANIVGGVIGKFDFRVTFYAMIPFNILMILVALSLEEPAHHKQLVKKNKPGQIFKVIQEVFRDVKLRSLLISAALLYSMVQAALWLYQPYMVMVGISIEQLGWLFAAFNVAAAIGSRYAYVLDNHLKGLLAFAIPLLFVATSYVFMSMFLVVGAIGFCFVQQLVRGYQKPVVTDEINQITHSHSRATILSISSMVSHTAYALFIPLLGYIADTYSLIVAFRVLGLVSILSAGIILWLGRRVAGYRNAGKSGIRSST